MKKRKIVVATTILLLVSTTIFLFVTNGFVREKDGLMQHSRIDIKDIYVQNGTLFYTLSNYSLQDFKCNSTNFREIQKRVDGTWQSCRENASTDNNSNQLGQQGNSFVRSYQRFHSYELSLPLSEENLVSGKYRIVVKNISGELYVVGYYTIPE